MTNKHTPMQSDPTSPQGTARLVFGEIELIIQTPNDLDALLDTAAEHAPDDVDAIPYYAILWPAAHGLATYLHQRANEVRGHTLIELGCGLALPSILSSRLGAQVTATDFHADTSPWVVQNAQNNGAELSFKQLDWNAFLRPQGPRRSQHDFVVGSDLLYEAKHIPALICAIDSLCAAHGEAIIADPGRNNLPIFCSGMEKLGWRYELIPIDEIFVCRFQRT